MPRLRVFVIGLAIGTTALGYSFDLQSPGNKSFRIFVTKVTEKVVEIRIPKLFLTPMLNYYSSRYKVIKEDLVKPIESFSTIQEFFTREVKPREIILNERSLLCPADSKLISLSKITSDEILLVKNINYSISEFMTNKIGSVFSEKDLKNMKKSPENDLYSLVFYLNPGDYHRFHSPGDFLLKNFEHFKGDLRTVGEDYIGRNSVE